MGQHNSQGSQGQQSGRSDTQRDDMNKTDSDSDSQKNQSDTNRDSDSDTGNMPRRGNK